MNVNYQNVCQMKFFKKWSEGFPECMVCNRYKIQTNS